MIGNVSPGAVHAFWHRRARLGEEIAEARRRVRAMPGDIGAQRELETLLANAAALAGEATASGLSRQALSAGAAPPQGGDRLADR